MVTSSFVNSLNVVQDMAKTPKPTKTQGDDKFKELMKKDDAPKSSEDKKVRDDKGQDDKNVKGKADKDDGKDIDQNQVNDGATDEKVLSSEIAKMLANVNSVVDVKIQESGVTAANSLKSGLVETNGPVKGVAEQGNGLVEEMVNPQQLVTDGKGENLAKGNVNEKIASQENGKIQLNEGFKPVDPNSDDQSLTDLLKDAANQKVAEEKVAENLGATVQNNSNKVDLNKPTMVQNNQFVSETEAMFKPEETIDKMAKTFVKEFTQGRREMEIALEPANLGKLTIKVAYDAGKAVVSILCSERNLDVISKNSAQIAGILQEYTGDDTKIVVEQPHADYLQQENEQNDQQQKEPEYKKENDKASDDKDAADFLEQLRLGLVKEV